MNKKFTMMGPDGMPVEYDDYGGLSAMFRPVRFKKGQSKAAPAPDYSKGYQSAQKQPATGTSAPGYDYQYRKSAPGYEDGYRAYPKPWSPPQLPNQASDTARNATQYAYDLRDPNRGSFIDAMRGAMQNQQQSSPNRVGGLIGNILRQSTPTQPAPTPAPAYQQPQQSPNNMQMGLPAFTPGGPDDPAMGGTGWVGGYNPTPAPAYQQPNGGNFVDTMPGVVNDLDPNSPLYAGAYEKLMARKNSGENPEFWANFNLPPPKQQPAPYMPLLASKLMGK